MRHVIRQSLDGDFGCVNCGEEHGSIVNFTIGCSEAKPATQEPREWQAVNCGPICTEHSHACAQPETPPETTLWDRLRADLMNLGAAYGPITEGVGEDVVTPEPVEIKAGEPVYYPNTSIINNGIGSTTRKGYVLCGETETNLFYDEVILAARKKREKQYGSLIYDPMSDNGHEWSWNTDACAHCGLTSTEIVENGDEHGDVRCDGGKARNGRLTLSAAMSRPLDFEPRVGHKGVEIG